MSAAAGGRRRAWAVAGLVMILAMLPFLPVLDAGFVNWDDDKNFVHNLAYRGLSFSHLTWMFTTFHYGGYHPLSWLSAGVDHALWGMDPTGYHLTNLLLHGVSAALLFLLLQELLGRVGVAGSPWRTWAAAAAAVLFAVHPLRVESVAWITERRGLLAAVFWTLTLWSYLRARGAGVPPGTARRYLGLSLAMYACSLLSKGMAITLPVLLLVLDVYPLNRLPPGDRGWRRIAALVVEKLPFVAITVVIGVLARLAQAEGQGVRSWVEHPFPDRCAQAAFGSCYYLWRTLVPADLCVLHPLEHRLDLTDPELLGAVVAVAGVSILLFLARRRWPSGLAAWIAYLVVLAPVSGIAQAGPSLVAERYSYLPMVPLAAIGSGLLVALGAGRGRGRSIRAGVVGLVLLLAVAWGAMSRSQSRVWRDSVALWTRAVDVHPDCVQARFNLGGALAELGRDGEAIAQYRRCVELMPSYGSAWYNLGLSCYRAKEPADSLAALRKAYELQDTGHWTAQPNPAELFYSLALAHHALGNHGETAALCRLALKASGGQMYLHAYPLLAEALERQGDRVAAIRTLEEALRVAPGNEALQRQLSQLRR